MARIDTLEESVHKLYAAKNPARADWCDWLGEHHVFVVADNATILAERFGANKELARAAALLHDIADASMSRFANNHEEESLRIARDLMQKAGSSKEEINVTVDDAIRLHSCHDGKAPESIEGKILATADSQAHLQTDFYVFATWAMGKEKSLADLKHWVLKKIDRDFNNKILFDEIKNECEKDYLQLNNLFRR